MRMREIRDLFLEQERGSERIRKEIEKAHHEYVKARPPLISANTSILAGCRFTMVPLSGPFSLSRPYTEKNFFTRKIELNFKHKEQPIAVPIREFFFLDGYSESGIKPMLNGGEKIWSSDDVTVTLQVFGNGTINLFIKIFSQEIYFEQVLFEMANFLRIGDVVRSQSGYPDSGYILDIEMGNPEDNYSRALILYMLSHHSGSINEGGILLSDYGVGNKETFSDLLTMITNDVRNYLGLYHLEGLEFNIKTPSD